MHCCTWRNFGSFDHNIAKKRFHICYRFVVSTNAVGRLTVAGKLTAAAGLISVLLIAVLLNADE